MKNGCGSVKEIVGDYHKLVYRLYDAQIVDELSKDNPEIPHAVAPRDIEIEYEPEYGILTVVITLKDKSVTREIVR